MNKLLSILLTTAILFANEGSNYFVDNFLNYSKVSILWYGRLRTLRLLWSWWTFVLQCFCNAVYLFTNAR